MDLFDRIMELSRYGYFCGQILAILTLETVGEENPGLVRAMGGLNGGVGFSQGCCGCMTGGACVMMTADYGGIDCRDITKGNPANRVELCPQIIAATYEKCMEILNEKGLL